MYKINKSNFYTFVSFRNFWNLFKNFIFFGYYWEITIKIKFDLDNSKCNSQIEIFADFWNFLKFSIISLQVITEKLQLGLKNYSDNSIRDIWIYKTNENQFQILIKFWNFWCFSKFSKNFYTSFSFFSHYWKITTPINYSSNSFRDIWIYKINENQFRILVKFWNFWNLFTNFPKISI